MLKSIISLSEKHGLIRKVISPVANLLQLQIGPVGNLLLHNLRNEWFYNIVVDNDITMFPNEDYVSTFSFAKQFCLEKLPFGLAQEMQLRYSKDISSNITIDVNDMDFDGFFLSKDKVNLKGTVFLPGKDSVTFFHKWQKQRRMWWRKFSANPGRYLLTDIKTDDRNVQSVEIVAKYPWKDQVVERLFLSSSCDEINSEALQVKEGDTTVQAHRVVSEVSLNTLFMNTICDAYDESEYKGNVRIFLRFHRKLAPFSISFAISTSSDKTELYDLALYLTKQLRSNHVSTLFLPNSSKLTLETQWRQYDELGVPYNVILNEDTLKNGMIFLRSRDTTLKEDVHVSELTTYVQQLFKNY